MNFTLLYRGIDLFLVTHTPRYSVSVHPKIDFPHLPLISLMLLHAVTERAEYIHIIINPAQEAEIVIQT